ncbi:MAG: glycosyltransferase family 4 protein [Deltaproteobacteria bacterium]|nr:glycosyltransferase family 4 protein [Deltaproteobacteria bacterium]
MHICVLSLRGISGNIPNWGGVNTHAKKLVSLLVDEGYTVSLITTVGEKIGNGPLTIIPINGGQNGRADKQWFQRAYQTFLSVHRYKHVDCVFSEGGAVRGLMNLMNDYKIPVVAFTHSLSMHYFYNTWQEVDGIRAFKSYVFRSLPRFVYDMFKMDIAFLRKCQKVVSGSTTIARQIERFYRIPNEKIRVIHNWVDPDEFRNDETARRNFREQSGILDDDVIFLLLGALSRKKGFRVALDSFEVLIKSVTNAYLLIAGEGPDRLYFENHISRSEELSQRVKLLGLYPHEKLFSLFSSADIFIIPSLMNEVLPYTLLEAMSCEIPVIASDIAANREALGNSGYFVPRGDIKSLTKAMLHFASNLPQKRSEAVLFRKRVIELFSYDVASKKIKDLLNEISKK